MADVFISYKREERQAVERLAQELRKLRLDVWFDASLNAGETFSDEIDREAHAAKAIMVCWSPTARDSQWVKAEALIGFEHRKLAACYVAGPDGFYPPAPFNSTHAEDLRTWVSAPSNTHAGYKSVLRRIGALCVRADIEDYGALDLQAPASTLRAWIERHQSSPLFLAVDELLRVRDAEEAERRRLEQQARERRAREAAEQRAKEKAEPRGQETRGAAEARGRGALWALIVGAGAAAALVIGVIASSVMLNAAVPQHEPASILTAGQSATDLSPGSGFRDCEECPEMVRLPVQSFAVGRYEVTIAQWGACVASGGCLGYTPEDWQFGRGSRGRHPVIHVSWSDAQTYVQWLSQRTGQRYRLPTEAEWEFAARAGATTRFYWGDQNPTCNRDAPNGANFGGCSGRSGDTSPVGSFQPNSFGLYDMHGNVSEWVEDCTVNCSLRVFRAVRGGSWVTPIGQPNANRRSYPPHQRLEEAGFRVARDL